MEEQMLYLSELHLTNKFVRPHPKPAIVVDAIKDKYCTNYQ